MKQSGVPLVLRADPVTVGTPANCARVEPKPLPRLPRNLARVYHEIGLFLRSIGLGIVVTAFAALRKDFVEPTKVAIRCSRVTALLRSLLHVIPLAVAITEIVLNYRGYYYGGYFSLQPYYQLAAKAHEITMQASLALIVLSFIRHHVAFSGGLPFGTFLGGLQFLQPSYLWSSELWASVAMKDSPRRKFIPLAFLIACGILAVTLGPASATLLIPRLIQWPLQPTQFSVNGSFQEIWPDLIEASNIPYDCTTLLTTDSKSLCPAGGWQDLIAAFNNSPDEYFVNNPEPGIGNIDIRDPKLSFSSTTAAQICQSSLKDQVCGSSIQAVVAEGAWSSIIEFTNAFDNQKSSQDAIHILSNDYYEPYVLASCGSQSVSRSNGNESLQFPLISESELDQGQVIVAVTNTTISQILDVTGNASEYRLQWIDLPYSDFGRALGAILLHPTDNETDSSINITNCAVGAGWGASAMGMSDEWGYILFSNIRGVPGSWHTREAPILNSIVQSVPDYGNHSGSIFPQRRMTIEPSFAELVNPTIVVNHDYNTSLVHLILSSDLAVEKGIEIDRVLVTMLTTGLARMGINLDWQEETHGSPLCANCTHFEVDHALIGYGYDSTNVTTKLAMAVMFIYCILVLAHVVYLGVSGISSTAWDSTAEIVALAINSSPTEYLQNTCAGITGIKVFQTNVRVRTTSNGTGHGGHDHLELVFGGSEKEKTREGRLKKNVEYGKLRVD